jgi:hypothetical protein
MSDDLQENKLRLWEMRDSDHILTYKQIILLDDIEKQEKTTLNL